MLMLLNHQKLKVERQQRAWSQGQLAEFSGVSLRTIQRIEKHGKASLESAKALAAVYDLSVADLYLTPEPEPNEANIQPNLTQSWCYFSPLAKTLAMTLFLLSSVIMLTLLWINIPTVMWINELRDAIFSAALSPLLLKLISSAITLLISISFALCCALLFDMTRNQGLYAQLKYGFVSGEISIKAYFQQLQQSITQFGVFSVKPLIITVVVVTLSSTAIYLNMADYQKQRLALFFQQPAINNS